MFNFLAWLYKHFVAPKDDGWITQSYLVISKDTYESYVMLLKGEFVELQEFHNDNLQADGWFKGNFPSGIMALHSRHTGLYYKRAF